MFWDDVIKYETIETNCKINNTIVASKFYNTIGAHVIKDRNFIGKFKIFPKYKGIVTILIGVKGIIHQKTHLYSETLLELMTSFYL